MNRRFALLQVVFSVVALAAVVWWASHQEAPEFPHTRGAIAWMVGAAVLYALATLIRAERWHRILENTHIHSSRADCYGLTCVGYMGNNVLPARAGEVLRVVLMDQRATTDDGGKAGKRTLLGTIVAERVLDLVVLAAMTLIVGFGVLHEKDALPSGKPLYVAGRRALMLIGLVVFKVLNDRGQLTRLRELARPLAGAPRALWSPAGIPLLAATILLWCVEGSVYLAVAKAVGPGHQRHRRALPRRADQLRGRAPRGARLDRHLRRRRGLRRPCARRLRRAGRVLRDPPAVRALRAHHRGGPGHPGRPLRRLGTAARHHPAPADEQRLAPMRMLAANSPAPWNAPTRTAPRGRRTRRPPAGLAMRWVLLGCLAVSALTLLFPSTPTYDPWAWLLWGREILHLDLVTDGGPSWKPLPVMFNVPFSIFGVEAAPYLWLWIARAGALLALVMSYRLARRLVGRGAAGIVAGVFAAAFLLTTYQYVRDSALGNSEALLAGLFLWGFERHLDGRRDHALYLGLAAALLRPEAWPFLGLYGLWLFVKNPELRLRVVLVGLAIPLLWFGPELWGSGEPFRASSRAGKPNPGSAAFAEHPGFEVVTRFAERAVIPLQAAGFMAVIVAALAWVRHRAQGAILALAGIGIAWILLVAVMTERGYAGNQRYLIVTTAALCVLGGIGIGRIFEGTARRWPDAAARARGCGWRSPSSPSACWRCRR